MRRPTKAAETRVAEISAAKERAVRDSADVVAKLEREKWRQNQLWRQEMLTNPEEHASTPNFRRPTSSAKSRLECSQMDKRKAAVDEGLAEAERQREEFRRNRERKRRSASSPADIGRKSPSYRRPTSAALQRRKEVRGPGPTPVIPLSHYPIIPTLSSLTPPSRPVPTLHSTCSCTFTLPRSPSLDHPPSITSP